MSYAGWYRHFLAMQKVHDHHALRWAESMADAIVEGDWFFPYSSSPDRYQRLKEGFSRMKERFRADQERWLRIARENTEKVEAETVVDVTPASPMPDQPSPPATPKFGQIDLFGQACHG